MTREALIARYQAYLDTCNRHAWGELAPFLAETMLVNGQQQTKAEYAADLTELDRAFPDYRWDLERALVEGEWLAVRLAARGTRSGSFRGAPGDGTPVATDELVMYRVVDGRIREIEGTADNLRLVG